MRKYKDSALLGGDSACGLESRISSPRFVDRPSSLISLRGLKSHDSSSTILESQSGFTKQVENLESTFESNTAKQAKRCKAKPQQVSLVIPRILEEYNQGDFEKSVVSSLRASFARVAIHKNNAKILESTFEKSQKMDCHAIAAALARNDRVGRVDRHADFQSARNDGAIAASQKVDSRENAKSLNESQNTKAQSVFDSEAAGFLMKKRGCAAFCAEISLVGFSTKRQTPRFFAKQAKRCKPKPKQASLVKSQRLHYKKAI